MALPLHLSLTLGVSVVSVVSVVSAVSVLSFCCLVYAILLFHVVSADSADSTMIVRFFDLSSCNIICTAFSAISRDYPCELSHVMILDPCALENELAKRSQASTDNIVICIFYNKNFETSCRNAKRPSEIRTLLRKTCCAGTEDGETKAKRSRYLCTDEIKSNRQM